MLNKSPTRAPDESPALFLVVFSFARYYRVMRTILLLMLLASFPVSAVTMYRWIDEQGVVHYSDTPRPGAVEIEVDEAQGYQPEPLYKSDDSRAEPDTGEAGYDSISITAPTQDQVLWNIGGVLNVVIDISPNLHEGDSVSLFYDSQDIAAPGSRRLSYVLNDVYRGAHSLRVAVFNRDGDEVQSSAVTRFQVQQTSVK